MKKLKRKANTTNEEWRYAFEHIQEFITPEQVRQRYDKTLAFIKETIKGRKVGFGWSAGKDSIVLADLMRDAGVTSCVLGVNRQFAFRSYLDWVDQNKPEGCEIDDLSRILDFQKMRKMGVEAFPTCQRERDWFSDRMNRAAFPAFCKKHGYDMFVFGNRKSDNNICGPAPTYVMKSKWGFDRFAPMAEWSVEEVLGYIVYFKGGYKGLPPQFQYDDGFLHGSGSPILYSCKEKTRVQKWEDVYKYDPDLVVRASQYLDSAKEYLSSINN